MRIADVRWYLGDAGRGRREYDLGHIPGAIYIDLERDLCGVAGPGRHPLPEPTALADRLGSLGIGDGHRVVAYDDAGGMVAARLWWMLDRLGHADVRVLDGGIAAWLRAEGVLERSVPDLPRATLSLATAWSGTIDRAAIVERSHQIDLIDLRAAARYRGDEEPIDRVAGHIPAARNRPAATLLAADGRVAMPDRLRAELEPSSDSASRPMVMSCGSGVTACFGALAARVAGLPEPLIYPGSYSDWSSAGMPIATGDAP